MNSARTRCLQCGSTGSAVVDLADLLYSSRVDYFRCRVCGCWWTVAKGANEPATRIIEGREDIVASADEEKAG